MQNRANAATSTVTMVAPVGVLARMEMSIPIREQHTEKMAEQMVTDKKLLKIRMADSAGKMIKAEIKREPTKFIASTMMTAMITAMQRL